jgi:hypothetical protein
MLRETRQKKTSAESAEVKVRGSCVLVMRGGAKCKLNYMELK